MEIVYVDQFREKTKGLIEDFGFYANRPFYLISRLPNRRFAECMTNYDVRLRRWNNSTRQQWYFDPVKKTIVSKAYTSRSLET